MKCVIIEDELPAQRVLHNYISKLVDCTIVGSYQSALEANTMLQTQQIDVLFLDINLSDISGIQYVKTLSNPPKIIITTAYHEHAVESFELDTICDYLVKPFSFERFLKAVNKIKREEYKAINSSVTNEQEELVFLNIDKTLHRIAVNDIQYIESDKNYVTLKTAKGTFTYIDSLKNWLVKLPEAHFIQVHKSYIINCNYVNKITGNVLVINNQKIPIGRLYKANFLKKLKL
jgi:DNA-binding LytR/AlgR family response regulator